MLSTIDDMEAVIQMQIDHIGRRHSQGTPSGTGSSHIDLSERMTCGENQASSPLHPRSPGADKDEGGVTTRSFHGYVVFIKAEQETVGRLSFSSIRALSERLTAGFCRSADPHV